MSSIRMPERFMVSQELLDRHPELNYPMVSHSLAMWQRRPGMPRPLTPRYRKRLMKQLAKQELEEKKRREDEQWRQMHVEKELQKLALQEERNKEEEKRMQAQLMQKKKLSDNEKASGLCHNILKHSQWVVFWEWARSCSSSAVAHWVKREEAVEYLMDVIKKTVSGSSALNDCVVEAAKHGLIDTIQAAIEKGARIDELDSMGNAALCEASANLQTDVICFLLEHGANINTANNNKQTALMMAAQNAGGENVVNLLLSKKANVHAKDWAERDAVELAIRANNARITMCLANAGGNVDRAQDAIRVGGDGVCWINAGSPTRPSPLDRLREIELCALSGGKTI